MYYSDIRNRPTVDRRALSYTQAMPLTATAEKLEEENKGRTGSSTVT